MSWTSQLTEACFLHEWANFALALGFIFVECVVCVWAASKASKSWKDVFRD